MYVCVCAFVRVCVADLRAYDERVSDTGGGGTAGVGLWGVSARICVAVWYGRVFRTFSYVWPCGGVERLRRTRFRLTAEERAGIFVGEAAATITIADRGGLGQLRRALCLARALESPRTFGLILRVAGGQDVLGGANGGHYISLTFKVRRPPCTPVIVHVCAEPWPAPHIPSRTRAVRSVSTAAVPAVSTRT